MRIFTKKSFKFRRAGLTVSTAALSFADVPEWVSKDPIFDLAIKEGSIEIIKNASAEKLIETRDVKIQDSQVLTSPASEDIGSKKKAK